MLSFDKVEPLIGHGAGGVCLLLDELERASECEGWADATKQ